MKITHIIFSFETGGAQTMLVDIVNKQIETAQVSLIIINNRYNRLLLSEIDQRVNIIYINRSPKSKNILSIIRLNKLILKCKFEVIHCHDHNIIPLLLPSLRKKTVLTIHDVGISFKYFHLYRALYAISQKVKDDILTRSGFDSTLIYNGICTDKIVHKSIYSLNKYLEIIVISRLNHTKKGQHIVIEALNILSKKGFKNIKLSLIGEGESGIYLKELVVKYGLENRIVFLGIKNRRYIYENIKNYDLLIQPSLYEGFGLTVAEGMAAKLPVLVSNIDGPMEIIDNGKYGFYFEVGNAESLSDQIIEILSNYNKERLNIEHAYRHVVDVFDIKSTAKNYINSYSEIII